MSAPRRFAAYWDWKAGAEVPDARIVLCAPATDLKHLLGIYGQHRASDESGNARLYVVSFPWSTETPPYWFIPALHITHQADLARLSGLLAVKAERRALVVSPEEAIDLDPLVCEEHGEAEIVYGDDGATPFCAECPGGEEATEMGSAGYLDGIDVVFIVGTDKAVHPDWVRSIVEQCRKAGVPVVFLGWGEWLPYDQASPEMRHAIVVERNYRPESDMRLIGAAGSNEYAYRVGTCGYDRSGAMLDGVAIEDVPAWLGGEA